MLALSTSSSARRTKPQQWSRTRLASSPNLAKERYDALILSVTQSFSEQGTELDAPFAQSLMADLNSALMQQFLDIPITQGKAVVQRADGVPNNCHGEAMAIRLGVSHGRSASPDPVKATQPSGKLFCDLRMVWIYP